MYGYGYVFMGSMAICGYMGVYGYMGRWGCGYMGVRPYGDVAMWLYGDTAICGYMGMFLHLWEKARFAGDGGRCARRLWVEPLGWRGVSAVGLLGG